MALVSLLTKLFFKLMRVCIDWGEGGEEEMSSSCGVTLFVIGDLSLLLSFFCLVACISSGWHRKAITSACLFIRVAVCGETAFTTPWPTDWATCSHPDRNTGPEPTLPLAWLNSILGRLYLPLYLYHLFFSLFFFFFYQPQLSLRSNEST